MSDLISRQAAIDALDKRFDSIPMNQTTEILLLRKDLRDLPSAQPEQRWIPCSERLPSKADHTDDMVLVCYRNGSVRFNTYMNWMGTRESCCMDAAARTVEKVTVYANR